MIEFDLREVVGLMAAACTTFSFVPQALQVIRERRTQDISLSMYVIFATGVLFWLIYGILIGSLSIMIANSLTMVLVLVILTMKIRLG